jgi:hypothetical protein
LFGGDQLQVVDDDQIESLFERFRLRARAVSLEMERPPVAST